MANSAVVGILRVLLTADSAEYETVMRRSADSAKSLSTSLKKMGDQATQVGASLTKMVTVPLLGLGVAAVKAASDFESSFTGVRKTVDGVVDKTGELTDFGRGLAQGLRDMAKEIPINVNELNRVAEAAGQLGIKKEDILQFTKTMAMLGETTNLTADEAASSTAKFQNIFGAAGKDVDRFGATLVALGNAGASTEKDIIEMGLRIAGAGHQVGMSQDQVLAFASSLSSVGINAEAGGSAISRVLLKINDAVMGGGPALEEFARVAGVTGAEFKQAFEKDAASATTTFIAGLGRLKSAGENINQTMEGLVGKNILIKDTLNRAAGAGELLTRDLKTASDGWRENTALVAEAAQRHKTFESQLTMTASALRDVGITVGNALLPVLRDLLSAMQPLIAGVAQLADGFAKLPEPVRLVAVGVAALVAAIGPALWAFGQVATNVGKVIGVFKEGGIGAQALEKSFAVIGPVVRTVATGFAALSAPMTAIIATIGAVSIAWAKLTGDWTRAFDVLLPPLGILRTAWDGLQKAIEPHRDLLNDIATIIRSSLVVAWEMVTSTMRDVADMVLPKLAAAWAVLRDGVKSVVDWVGTKAVGAFNALKDTLANIPGFDLLLRIWERMKTAGVDAKQAVHELATEMGGLAGAVTSVDAPAVKSATSLKALGESQKDIAKALGISEAAVRLYLEGLKAGTKATKDHATEATKAAEAQERFNASITRLSIQPDMFASFSTVKEVRPDLEWFSSTLNETAEETAAAEKATQEWANTTGAVLAPALKSAGIAAEALASKGDGIGGAFKNIAQRLPDVLMRAFQGGGDVGKSVGGLIGGELGQSISGSVGSWLSKGLGKTLGGALGSIIPGLGTALGGLLGSLGDKLFGKLFGGDAKKTRQLRDQFLDQAGGLAEVQKMADYAGVSIDRLMNTKKPKEFTAEVEKLQAAFKATQERVASTVKDLQDLSAKGGLISDDLLARLTRDADKDDVRAAFKEFQRTEVKRTADGLSDFLAARGDLQEALNAAKAQLADMGTDARGGDMDAAKKKVADLEAQLSRLPALTQQSAEAMGAGLLGVYAKLTQEGASPVEALKELAPAIADLKVQLDAAGLDGGAALGELASMASIAADEVTGPLLRGVQGLGQAITGAFNTGMLSPEMFAGLSSQIGAAYKALEAQGKGGQQALALMQPAIQAAWEAEQRLGVKADEATQSVIDQAVEAGRVGPQFMSSSDKMVAGLDKVVDRFDRLLRAMGVEVPAAAESAAAGVNAAFDGIEAPQVPAPVVPPLVVPDVPPVEVPTEFLPPPPPDPADLHIQPVEIPVDAAPLDRLKGSIAAAASGGGGLFGGLFDGLVGGAAVAGRAIAGVGDAAAAAGERSAGGLSPLLRAMGLKVPEAADAAAKAIADAAQSGADAAQDAAEQQAAAAQGAAEDQTDAADQAASEIREIWRRSLGDVSGDFKETSGLIKGDWKDAFGGAKDESRLFFDSLRRQMDQIPRQIEFRVHGRVDIDDPGATPDAPDIPALARGGLVTGPTLALVGEAGPELVTPLERLPGLMAQAERSTSDQPPVINNNMPVMVVREQDPMATVDLALQAFPRAAMINLHDIRVMLGELVREAIATAGSHA